MKSLVKYAALPAALLCGALLALRADSATLSAWAESSVGDHVTDCYDSRAASGPLLSGGAHCDSGTEPSGGRAVAHSGFSGEVTDVYGDGEFWVSSHQPWNPEHPYWYTHASMGFDLEASGFFYILAPASTVDLTLAVDCGFWCRWDMTVNGTERLGWNPANFRNVPSRTPIRYSLESRVGFRLWTISATTNP